MAVSWPFARHSRWQKQLDAYIDGELSADALRKFEAHSVRCSACTAEMAGRRELKRMAQVLPQLPAPRSFRITPGMLVEAPAARPTTGRPIAMRVAQVTAGLAVLGFAAVLALDLAGSDEGGTTQQASQGDGANAETFDAANPLGTTVAEPGTAEYDLSGEGDDDDAGGLPSLEDDVRGQGYTEPTAAAGSESLTRDDFSNSPEGPVASDANNRSAAGSSAPPTDDGVASSIGADEVDDDEGRSGFVVAEIGLLALAAVAGVTWLSMRRGRAG